LTRWLNQGVVEYSNALRPRLLYSQVGALLKGLGVSAGRADLFIERAIFEEQKWGREAVTAQDQLLFSARQGVARHFGGEIKPKLEGVDTQVRAPVPRWLRGEHREHGAGGVTAQSFYNQVRALFGHLGSPETEIDAKVEAAIFAEQGWKREAGDASEQLLFMGRRQAARHFGGILSRKVGIPGIAPQREKAYLSRWLQGKNNNLDDNLTPQIHALLTHGGFTSSAEAERLIAGATGQER
jgi:hypothetical protein